MPSHKVLKSIAHNFGASFTSMMNYRDTDYMLGHIQKKMKETGIHELHIDISNIEIQPMNLKTETIWDSIIDYCKSFPDFVGRSRSSMDLIKSATMTIKFDLTISRPWHHDSKITENPYECIIQIIDDRGKEYKSILNDWWFPEA